MAPDFNRVRDRISELAQRPKNVRISEIEWVMNQLSSFGFTTRAKPHAHGIFFTVNGYSFNVCTHHKGSSQVRPIYVTEFLNAMIELELY